jgi:hypothetical protein
VEVKVYLSAREGAVNLVHAGGDLDPDGDRVRDAHPLGAHGGSASTIVGMIAILCIRLRFLLFLQNVTTTVSGQQGSR